MSWWGDALDSLGRYPALITGYLGQTLLLLPIDDARCPARCRSATREKKRFEREREEHFMTRGKSEKDFGDLKREERRACSFTSSAFSQKLFAFQLTVCKATLQRGGAADLGGLGARPGEGAFLVH